MGISPDHRFAVPGTIRARAAGHVCRRDVLRAAAAAAGLLVAGRGAAMVPDPRPFSVRIVQSGHSLTDPIVPMLDAMVAAAGRDAARRRVIDRSTVPGSPMDWRWNNSRESGPDARRDIADYDILVITERVPLSNTMPWHDSEEMGLRWFTHAWQEGRDGQGAQTILYATWVHTDSGPDFENPYDDPEGHMPFRERLPREMANWQAIADHVNARRPGDAPPMRVIPGPVIMAAAHDAIEAGRAPGLSRIEELFSDTIHLSDAGAYLIALAHFAVIYGRDPREVPDGLGRHAVPAPRIAAWMKDLVHDILCDYPDSGLANPD